MGQALTAWHVIFYTDEVVPGNVLHPENHRKFWAFYFSFREFGPGILCRRAAWIPVAILRSHSAKEIQGQMARATRALLCSCFAGDRGLSTVGVVMKVGLQGSSLLFFARLSNLVGDEGALKAMFANMGAGGNLPCMKCRNVLNNTFAGLCNPGFVTIAEPDRSKFRALKDESIWGKVDLLEQRSRTTNKGDFKELQTASGFNHCPEGILADKALREHIRPALVHTYDPMHNLFSSGMVGREISLMFDKMKEWNIKRAEIESIMQLSWEWPTCHKVGKTSVAKIFNAYRWEKAKEKINGPAQPPRCYRCSPSCSLS